MFDDKPLVFVDDADKLKETAHALAQSPVIGVDTESDSFYHYQEKVCLIQFSDLDRDYIVDPLAVEDLSILGPLLADPSIVKVLHGADYDVVCLGRDYGFEIHGLFDTLIASQLLALEKIGLADLIGRFFGIHVEKKYQRHDWSRRPLGEEHIDYAKGDTQYLLALREILTRKLKRAGRISHMEEECQILEKRKWTRPTFDENGYLNVKGAAKVQDPTTLRVLKRLFLYRDEQARKLDRPAFKVFPDRVMLDLAQKQPTSMSDLDQLFSRKQSMKRRHANAMLTCVEKGVADDFPIPKRTTKKAKPKPKRKNGPPARLRGRSADRVHQLLKQWRNDLVERDKTRTPTTVASNNVLRSIAVGRPTTLEELGALDDVRRWQVRDFGDELLSVLDEIAPMDGSKD
jgi:ribonuclease D